MAKPPPADHDDPVINSSLSVPLFVSTLILMLTLVWAIYDELYTLRPWKDYQARFVQTYSAYLKQLKPKQAQLEQDVKSSEGYQELTVEMEQAETQAAERLREINRRINQGVTPRMGAVRRAYQTLQGEIGSKVYLWETSENESDKESYNEEIAEIKQRQQDLDIVLDDGSGTNETVTMTYEQMGAEFGRLRTLRAELQGELVDLNLPARETRAERDAYLQERLHGLTELQVDGLIGKMESFSGGIKQIHLADIDLVDRCESCHLGNREPVELSAASMGGESVFASHPSPDLLKIHDPEEFGCVSCHNGNGRATSSVTKGHGRYKHWLFPLYEKENIEAGCQQCHSREVVTDQAETLNQGRALFLNRGCWGCHRFEGFDREAEELAAVRRQIQILGKEQAANRKETQLSIELGDGAAEDDVALRYYARAETLTLRNSSLDSEVTTLRVEAKNLVREVKKFGPSLREIKVKLRKEWIPVWLKDPHEFRPGSKMPVFRLEDEDIQAISAYIWRNAIEGELEQHPPGNAERGQELFETRGCLGCHSIGVGEDRIGGDFAANLSRVGEKTNYNFLVRWIHNPREVTPDPNDPEGGIRFTPVMPSLRLSPTETRDIASYLMTQKTEASYDGAPFMDSAEMAEKGEALVRHYGCAGCHEISGMETEGRIGTELTLEGSKPIERLDFALKTHEAEHDGWYNHKGFFSRKLKNAAFFDEGKVKAPLEKLRMPDFNFGEDEITALTTFLMGAVDTRFPQQYRHEPEDEGRDIQEGWWLVRRYNCNGCHQIRPGDVTSFMTMPRYRDPEWAEQLPPQLYTEGARVQPDWLTGFLANPAQSESDIYRNGLRTYLEARMPTFYFSDGQVAKLMRFFMARSSQPLPYLPEALEPLSSQERIMSRQLFSGRAAPCLKCHATGNAVRDRNATAPNFLLAAERLKPDWTYRWMLEPANIAPGTAMPSELFRHEDGRWIFDGPLPATFQGYEKDHSQLLVRYMFQFTPDELRRLLATAVASGG